MHGQTQIKKKVQITRYDPGFGLNDRGSLVRILAEEKDIPFSKVSRFARPDPYSMCVRVRGGGHKVV
jgi:hypothetical protein